MEKSDVLLLIAVGAAFVVALLVVEASKPPPQPDIDLGTVAQIVAMYYGAG